MAGPFTLPFADQFLGIAVNCYHKISHINIIHIFFSFYFNRMKSKQAELTASCSQKVGLNNCITEILKDTNWILLTLTTFQEK